MHWVIIAGSFLNIIGSLAYARDVLRGKANPNLVTFGLWAVAPMIGVAAMLVQGAGWAAVPVSTTFIGPLLILAAAFFSKQAYWQSGPFDYMCGLFSLLALILWQVTSNANVAILFSLLSDALAAVPTVRKAWKHPETETPLAYVAAVVSQLTAFIAAPIPSFAAYAFPVYVILICGSISGILYYRSAALART